jgi:hypothetical protein
MKYGRGLSVQASKQIPDEYTGDIKAVAGVAGGEGGRAIGEDGTARVAAGEGTRAIGKGGVTGVTAGEGTRAIGKGGRAGVAEGEGSRESKVKGSTEVAIHRGGGHRAAVLCGQR